MKGWYIIMKENKIAQLLHYLRNIPAQSYASAQELADHLQVSTRQVRKYIVKLHQESGYDLINSTHKGYRLDLKAYSTYLGEGDQNRLDSVDSRKNYIIQKLICTSGGYDIFDFEEELYVSSASLENDMKNVRDVLKRFDLILNRDKNIFHIEGSEKQKRNLMSHIISSDSYDNFILKDEVQILTYHYHFPDFRKNISDIFAKNDIFANDYTLNNTAMHLIITIDRIRNHYELKEDVQLDIVKDSNEFQVASCIARYIERQYQVVINDSELYNLCLLISNHTTMMDYSFVDESNIAMYIEQKYIDIAHQVLHKVEKCYYLDTFDEDFIVKFTIHVKNLFNRVEHHYFAKNPLTKKVKSTYPLIYDIAVFIAQEFKNDYQIVLNEDEIAFIAFHIGSYFENNVQSKTKLTCMFIYADYYSMYKNTLEKIARIFDDHINMKYAISIHSYNPAFVHADLIISTVDMPYPTPYININPFLTNKDVSNLQTVIDHILSGKRRTALKAYLMNFFDHNLFYKNVPFKNEEDAITYLSEDVTKLGYANEHLSEQVLAREHMSSTAFQQVAVPHSLGNDVMRSFISISIHEIPISWHDHKVQVVALIGVHEDSRKIFAEVFDDLIDILSEPSNIKQLVLATDFDDFLHRILLMMDHIQEV